MPITLNGTTGLTFGNGSTLGASEKNILQTSTVYAGPAIQTIASLTPVIITGLSINFTPKSSTSRLIISSSVTYSTTLVVSLGIFKDSVATVSTTGQTNNNEANMNFTNYIRNNAGYITQAYLIHSEISGSTTARTYDVRLTSGWGNTVYTVYVHNRSSNDMAGFAYMEIMEIEV
jgi:hypothetical protein